MASAGVPAIDSLPPELLDTIFGFLDVRTLCTARLVCAQFRSAASQLLHSVELSVETLRRRPETNLSRFPNLSRVTVFDVKEGDLLMLARHPVAHAVTHLRAVDHLRPVLAQVGIAAGSPLLPLPNLMSLTVSYGVFPFPQTLRELNLGAPVTRRAANLVTGLTNLTCLRINMRKPFEGITALTALQRLDICSELSIIPFVAELTLLTHLQFRGKWRRYSLSDLAPLASLARLHRLLHLGFLAEYPSWDLHIGTSLERQFLSSIATFTGLRSLDLALFRRLEQTAFEAMGMTPFSQLTALRLRGLPYAFGLDASFLSRFNLERLQDLSLSHGVRLTRDGVAALRQATGLTHLELSTTCTSVYVSAGLQELELALACMSRLRSLSLGTPKIYQSLAWGTPDAVRVTFSLKAIALLTELTTLELRGRGVATDADMGVCLGLENLRALRMEVDVDVPTRTPSDRIPRESFFALAKLPELRRLEIAGNFGILGWNLRDNVRAWVHAERHAKGWPPLEFNIRGSI